VGALERAVSVVGGAGLLLGGLFRGGARGAAAAVLGAFALKRGITGRCELRAALPIDRAPRELARPTIPAPVRRPGVDVSASVTISRTAPELYAIWRDPANLPDLISVLQSVEPIDDAHARWTLRAPFGREVAFDAEITADEPDRRIAWRAAPGALIEHVGEIRFRDAPLRRGTEVALRLRFMPPGGAISAAIAGLVDDAAEMKLRGDLKRFQQRMETGEVARTEGQAAARG
jgi:uncharacterized membrane protein